MIVEDAPLFEAPTSWPTVAVPNPQWPQKPSHPHGAGACDDGDKPQDQAPSPSWPRVFPGL